MTGLILATSGCSSLMDSMAGGTDLLGTTKARINQSVADAVGLGSLEDAVLASLIYSQVFFAGGYGYGYDNFKEGEGVVWEITSKDANGAETVEIERALLKRNGDGTAWWLLRYTAEGEDEFISEALLDSEYELLVFRYRDPETDTIREWIPEQEESIAEADAKGTDEDADAEEVEVGFFYGNYSDYSLGMEKVTVPAGTYTAEHVRIEERYVVDDGETGNSYEVSYEWWISGDVPGELVKYIWANLSDETSLSGELAGNKSGYTTQLSSF